MMRYVSSLPPELRFRQSDPQFIDQAHVDQVEKFFDEQGATVIRIDADHDLAPQLRRGTDGEAPVIVIVPRFDELADHSLEQSIRITCAVAAFRADMGRSTPAVQVIPVYATSTPPSTQI